MIYGIISDIHANLEALTVAINYLIEQGVSEIFCCGDIVGYGPDPSGCISFLKRYNFKSVHGNHDRAILTDSIGIYFNEDALVALNIQKFIVSSKDIEFLKRLPFAITENNFLITHSFLNKKDPFKYVLDRDTAKEDMELAKKQILFIGHSHIPSCFTFEDKNIQYSDAFNGLEILIERDKKYLVNVGSIGQPRDGNPRLSLCIYDVDKNKIRIVRLTYPVNLTMQKMKEKEFPKNLYNRLVIGY
jgi:predicted phosphodiesterase